jgi:hypothetical protein
MRQAVSTLVRVSALAALIGGAFWGSLVLYGQGYKAGRVDGYVVGLADGSHFEKCKESAR